MAAHQNAINVTLATPQQAPQIAQAIASCFFPHPNLLGDLLHRFSLPFPQHFCIIVTFNGEIVGVLEMVVLDSTAFLMNLCVVPAVRGLGIASGLMAIAHQIARKIGVKQIYLTVLPKNIAARSLYLRLGYSGLNQVKFMGADALLMERSL